MSTIVLRLHVRNHLQHLPKTILINDLADKNRPKNAT